MEAVLASKPAVLSLERILKGIERSEMNARFEGVDLTQDPLWCEVIKPKLLSGEIDFDGIHPILDAHYAQQRHA